MTRNKSRCRRPMGRAAARAAKVQLDGGLSRIGANIRLRAADDRHVCRVKIAPDRAVALAERAIAVVEKVGPPGKRDDYPTTMAMGLE